MRAGYRRGRDRRPAQAGEQDRALQGTGEEVQRADRGAARNPGEERVRPHLHRGRRLGHERLHHRGHDRLLHHRAGQQAGALDVDGVGAAAATRSSASFTPSATWSSRNAACARNPRRWASSTKHLKRCSGTRIPYGWPTVGWPSDIPAITKAQADEFYALYYAPQNITLILVGDFKSRDSRRTLAQKYFGRIPRGKMKRRTSSRWKSSSSPRSGCMPRRKPIRRWISSGTRVPFGHRTPTR